MELFNVDSIARVQKQRNQRPLNDARGKRLLAHWPVVTAEGLFEPPHKKQKYLKRDKQGNDEGPSFGDFEIAIYFGQLVQKLDSDIFGANATGQVNEVSPGNDWAIAPDVVLIGQEIDVCIGETSQANH